MQNDINNYVVPLLRQYEPEYVNDSSFSINDAYATTLTQVFENLRNKYKDLDKQAKVVANDFTYQVSSANKDRFYRSIENVVGVNLQTIIQNEGLEDTLVASTSANVSLIKSIPDEYFKKVENAVFTGTTQGKKATSMIKDLQDIGKVTKNRAKIIARDQTSKLNSALNQQRQQNLGIEEYIWVSARDGERVRKSHASKDGKRFRWDSPPPDTGHPGEDIQCRCIAQPIIKI